MSVTLRTRFGPRLTLKVHPSGYLLEESLMRVRENSLILEIVAIVVSYLLGSVSFSVLLAKILKGIDIRQHGAGNAGATNTLRVLGKGPAILVLALM